VRDRPALRVVAAGLTDERLAVAVRLGHTALAEAINGAQPELADSGILVELAHRWLDQGTGFTEVLG
ncbi:MAG: hypothetical protein ACJ8H8_07310, partial [Geminicoccaceae bacterium]